MRMDHRQHSGFEGGLAIALEHIDAPAFLLRQGLDVRATSQAARRMVEEDPVGTKAQLKSVLSGVNCRGTVRTIRADGEEPWFFVVLDEPTTSDVVRRVSTVARRTSLTPAQTRVLMSLAQGLTNAGIAAELRLSQRTIESHVVAIFDKLGVSTRAGVLATLLTA